MGQTRHKCMGGAKPRPSTWVGLSLAHVKSALHCSYATWKVEAGVARRGRRWKRRGEGLTCDGYCCCWSCWRRQAAALVVHSGFPSLLPLYFFLLLSPLFFRSLFCFFFFPDFPPLLSSLFFVFFPPHLPCIYRQKTGEREVGAATVLPPLYRLRDTSPPFSSTRGKLWASGGPWLVSFLCFLEEESQWK